MRVDVVTESLSNLEVATIQLDRAIALFFDERDYISSLTLAGAAEEILGKLLKNQGENHALDEIIKDSLVFNEVELGSQEEPKAKKIIANLANYYKNRLKHFSDTGGVHFSSDFYAAEIIDRARKNYIALTNKETELMGKFHSIVLEGIE